MSELSPPGVQRTPGGKQVRVHRINRYVALLGPSVAIKLTEHKLVARKVKEIKTPGGSTLSGIAEVAHERNAPESGGQSGDTQGLSDIAEATFESVKELVEEGQYFEAAVVSGIENAPDPDVAEVRTREVPEDDVPLEYLNVTKEFPA